MVPCPVLLLSDLHTYFSGVRSGGLVFSSQRIFQFVLHPIQHFMSSSNCCFMTCIQISQEAGQVVWYSHLLKNFPQFVVIHIVKGFGVVNNKSKVDVFLELSCFFDNPSFVANLISGSSAFSKFSLNMWKFLVHVLLKPRLENFEHCFVTV